jgi:hypothetical protein
MRALVLLVLVAALGIARADSWPAARPSGKVSPDGNIVARVTPGESLGDVYGFAGAKKGRYAKAGIYRLEGEERYVMVREVALLNPVAPVDFVVSNAGELLTLDNWHNLGVGKVLVVYGGDGRVLRSYSLVDIYSPEELRRFEQSVSSISWRCTLPPFLERGSSVLEIGDTLGNLLEVEMRTGALSKRHVVATC